MSRYEAVRFVGEEEDAFGANGGDDQLEDGYEGFAGFLTNCYDALGCFLWLVDKPCGFDELFDVVVKEDVVDGIDFYIAYGVFEHFFEVLSCLWKCVGGKEFFNDTHWGWQFRR